MAQTEQPLRDDEPVPLSLAASVAYFHLVEAPLRNGPRMAEAIGLAAMALGQVAQVRVRDAGVARALDLDEARELLLEPLRRRQPVDLDRFCILRGELYAAITELEKIWRGCH